MKCRFICFILVVTLLSLAAISQPAQADDNVWTSIGPEGGNVRGLVISSSNLNIIYAALQGGLFKSVDGGGSWLLQHTWRFSSLAIDPVTPTTLYAGTSQSGIWKNAEIYRSTDGGATWSERKSGLETVGVLTVNQGNPDIVYARRSYDGMLSSDDSGTSWHGESDIDQSINAIAADPVSTNIAYAGTASGVFKTVDTGAHWTLVNTGLPDSGVIALAINPTTPTTIYAGTYKGVFKSTNGGESWAAVSIGQIDTKINDLAIDPVNPSIIYAHSDIVASETDRTKIYKSIDGGANWGLVYSEPHVTMALAVDPVSPERVFIGTYPDGIIRSIDGGTSWNASNSGITNSSVNSIVIDGSSPNALYAATSIGILKGSGVSADWERISRLSAKRLVINPITPTILYAGTEIDGVQKSVDGGVNWVPVNAGVSSSFLNVLVIDPATPTTLYRAYRSVYKTTDGAEQWQERNTGLPDDQVYALAIDPVNPATLYAGTGGNGVYKSVDGANSWNPVNDGLPASSQINALAVDPVNPSTIYVARYGSVYKSTDGGDNWLATNTGIEGRINVLTIDAHALYVGTDGGVYRSADGGLNWQSLGSGFYGTGVRSIAIDPSDPNTIYAGTWYAGAFRIRLTDTPAPANNELVLGLGAQSQGWFNVRDDDSAGYGHLTWKQLRWDEYTSVHGETRPAPADVDGRGEDEILVGLKSGANGWFEIRDGANTGYGHLTWIQVPWSSYNSANGETRPVGGDVDGDGRDEIIVGLGNGAAGWIEIRDDADNGYAHLAWIQGSWGLYNRTHGGTRPAAGDFDGDGREELVISLDTGGHGWLEIRDDATTGYAHVTWLQIPWTGYNNNHGGSIVAAGDVDGDGRDEIIVGLQAGGDGWIEILDDATTGYAHLSWQQIPWSQYNSNRGETRPAAGDVDGDGRDEIVVGLASGAGGWYAVREDAAGGFAHKEWLKVPWTAYNNANGETWPAVGDFENWGGQAAAEVEAATPDDALSPITVPTKDSVDMAGPGADGGHVEGPMSREKQDLNEPKDDGMFYAGPSVDDTYYEGPMKMDATLIEPQSLVMPQRKVFIPLVERE